MSLLSTSRVTKSKSKPQKTHKSSYRSSTSPSSAPLISLQAYVSNIFFGAVIQDQDDIAEIVYKRNWSAHVKEKYESPQCLSCNPYFYASPECPKLTLYIHPEQYQKLANSPNHSDNGKPLNFKNFNTFLIETRASLTNRQLISQSFLVVPTPGDEEGRTGTVAHTSKLSGILQEKEVVGNVVAVLQIGWDEELGRRQVFMETFCLGFE